MKKEKICSAGLLYFHICYNFQKEGKATIEINHTYKTLLDKFYEKMTNSISELDNKNKINIFGCVGEERKVSVVKKIVCDNIKNNANRIIEGKNIIKEDKNLDETGNVFNKIVQVFFYERLGNYPDYNFSIDDGVEIFYLYNGNAPINNVNKIVNLIVSNFFEQECFSISGKQAMIKSFYLQNFVGRKLLKTFSDSHNDVTLLFEGGRKLKFDSEFCYDRTVTDCREMGSFSTLEVESITMNPAYALKKLFEPYDLYVEWQKVFLYVCALKKEMWDIKSLKEIYLKFMMFIEKNICEVYTTPPLIEEELFYQALLVSMNNFQRFLQGKEEAIISKELLQVLDTRYVYIPYILELFNDEKEEIEEYSNNIMKSKIEKAQLAQEAYERGKLWEEVAQYYLKHIDGLKITGTRIKVGYQEIDISLANVSEKQSLWNLGAYILVECKNYHSNVGVKEIRNIGYICNMKGCKTALFFSCNGLTKDAKKEIGRLAANNINIICIDKKDLLSLTSNEECEKLLEIKYRELEDILINNELI